MDNGMTLADIAAVSRGDGFLEGNGIIILILFFLIFGFGGNWGGRGANNEGCATPEQVYDATNQQTINSKLDSIANGICSSGYENANLINNLNIQGMQNTNSITAALNNGFNNVNANITALGYQMSQCCCDLKTQMLQDKYDDVRNQLNLAEMASANAVQTQNILGQLGRYYTYPAMSPCSCYNQSSLYGTTVS